MGGDRRKKPTKQERQKEVKQGRSWKSFLLRGTTRVINLVTMETFFGKRSLLVNIKIKAVMNKKKFHAYFDLFS